MMKMMILEMNFQWGFRRIGIEKERKFDECVVELHRTCRKEKMTKKTRKVMIWVDGAARLLRTDQIWWVSRESRFRNYCDSMMLFSLPSIDFQNCQVFEQLNTSDRTTRNYGAIKRGAWVDQCSIRKSLCWVDLFKPIWVAFNSNIGGKFLEPNSIMSLVFHLVLTCDYFRDADFINPEYGWKRLDLV